MAKTIWRFPILARLSTIGVPVGARFLSVAFAGDGTPSAYYLVDRSASHTERKKLAVYDTGSDIPDDPGKYLGTLHAAPGVVFHVFELGVASAETLRGLAKELG